MRLASWGPVLAVTCIRPSLVCLQFLLFGLGQEKVFPARTVSLHGLTEEDRGEFLRGTGAERTVC